MSSSQRSSKAMTYRNRKRVRTGTTIPPTLAGTIGRTQRYRAKAVIPEGRKWLKSHKKDNYFSDVVLEDVNLETEFPQSWCHLLKLHICFVFQEPSECNVNVVQNSTPNGRFLPVLIMSTVRGIDVPPKP